MRPPRLRGTSEENHQVRTRWILDAVVAADPDLPEAVVVEILDRLAPTPYRRGGIAADLYARPERLTSGDSECRTSTQQMIKMLVEAGSTRIRRPHCKLCRRIRDLTRRLEGGGMVCQLCARLLSVETCSSCGQPRPPQARLADGRPLCNKCWLRSQETTCHACGRRCPGRRSGIPVCQRCRTYPTELCARCHRPRRVNARVGGEALCRACARRPHRICARCRYPRAYLDPDPGCTLCSSPEPLRCERCGDDRFAFRIGPHGCVRCQLLRKVDQLGDGADPARVDQLSGFLLALTQAGDPRRALDWLGKTRSTAGRTVLLDMLHARVPIHHESLDAAAGAARGRATSVEFLRQLLVDSGTLPDRDEHLSRLERSIAAVLETCHPDDTSIIQQYATWRVLATARSRVSAGRPSQAVAPPALGNVVAAARFLAWIRSQNLPAQAVTQTAVDRWLIDNPSYRNVLAVFLRWASRRHLLPAIEVAAKQNWPPRDLAPATHQMHLLRRLLHDDNVATCDRLAGCLVLLYGQPLSRICQLRLTDVDMRTETLTLRLGDTPLELPPRIADLAREAVAERLTSIPPGISKGFTQSPTWLFPGRPSTRPAGAESLRRRLAALGVVAVRSTRNTALITLAREVPPVVLADLLGLTIGAAVRWRELSGGTWGSYIAERQV